VKSAPAAPKLCTKPHPKNSRHGQEEDPKENGYEEKTCPRPESEKSRSSEAKNFSTKEKEEVYPCEKARRKAGQNR
jgi:hypothetical protein